MVVLNELLPGSSSSSSTHHHDHDDNHLYVYDVFLSFRGADTRNSFTDHLYNAFLDAGIKTFLDDEEIETGEPLKPELESAIKSSRASIIVLSTNYASSTWCLDELVLILEQNTKFNQIVIPIFFDVEPTDVRKQQSSFGEAMANHKVKMETETNAEKISEWCERIESWKKALTQVADLKGKDAKDRKETEFIKEVVTEIHRRLGVLLSNTLPLLIGMDHHIRFISSWLTNGSCHTPIILTVVGMGGIGKTSLAKYIFGLHSTKFHKSSFIEGINRRCKEKFTGLLDLQKQLCTDISKKIELHVNDVSVYTCKIENALARKRVFVVLDDIGSLDELDALLGNKGLYPGSKIIITTQNASLIERCAFFNSHVHPNHIEVVLKGLYKTQSLELLCIHAFKSRNPKEGYKEVSENLTKYCDGHPLALEVLGREMYNRDVEYWEECIKKLKKEPHFSIKNALHMSFDSLPSNDKELLKTIACFFVGMDRVLTETVLNACGIYTKSGITNLVDRCLLGIEFNTLMMHQLVQEMVQDLVRQESPHRPWERTRVWCHEDLLEVLEQKEGMQNLIGLAFDMRMLEKEKLSGPLEVKTDALSKMHNLKLLQLNYVKINGSYRNISKELRWLCMHGSRFKSIPSDLPMANLVALDMSHSNIESFDISNLNRESGYSQCFVSILKWLIGSSSKDKQLLGSLKILDLSFCEQLQSVGGFLELPALERLILRNCISLIEVCESVEKCVDLVHIDLRYCYKLKKAPTSIGKLKKVKTLWLDGPNPRESQIKTCDINPSDIRIHTQNSPSVIPSDSKFLTVSLPSSLVSLSLANNNLSNESFPMDFSCLLMLEELNLNNNPIISMPNCVRTLSRLRTLFMNDCDMLISVENPPRTVTTLLVRGQKNSIRKIKFVRGMSRLFFAGVKQIPDSPFEIDGMVKIEAMACVEKKILHSLGWTNLEFIEQKRLEASTKFGSTEYQTQMYYNFGIFTTIYEGEEMPDWIKCRSMGSSISFTIPSSSNNLRGLNFCFVETTSCFPIVLPLIKVSNITKNHTWIYKQYIDTVTVDGNDCLILLSHWLFGPNEMRAGDHITITLVNIGSHGIQCTKECGISVLYEDEEIEEEEDVLGYYKSWGHRIGRDLSHFRIRTGEYLLYRMDVDDNRSPSGLVDFNARYKAFSQKKKPNDQGRSQHPNPSLTI
ncbi:hypothetical protein SSX86_006666 [Deinandra increscens subsp. villosa]|uniref:TIR domain-containing protein n=1 Tax=Deinandra increscens subsp. villosa TaxID=3103831 RepID=A0AAP0H5V8_9ASTR